MVEEKKSRWKWQSLLLWHWLAAGKMAKKINKGLQQLLKLSQELSVSLGLPNCVRESHHKKTFYKRKIAHTDYSDISRLIKARGGRN